MLGRASVLAVLFAVLGAGSAGAATGTISTVAGTGTAGFSGDGGPAIAAQLRTPVAVLGTADGGFLLADQGNSIRRVGPDGTIRTVAGTGVGAGYSGDGGPATSANMDAPSDVEQLADGSLLIADINNNAVRRVAPDGTMSTVVGDGSATFGGDGGPASAAKVRFPYDIALLPGGGYLIVDQDNDRIRRVGPDGIISTVAGNGTIGAGGDGGPATSAQLNDPSGVVVLPDGGFLIADTANNRIRRVTPDGTISTFAGTTAGFGGDGGPATAAKLDGPIHLALLPDGGVVIADWHNNRVRKVDASGVITTLVGDGTAASTGDGGPATAATLNAPFGVGVASDGDVLVAEATGRRIRRIDLGDPPPPAARGPVAELKLSAAGAACVGKPVTFDASASTAGTGGPIVDYRFTEVAQAPGAGAKAEALLAQGAAPTAQTQFGWNRATDAAGSSLAGGLGGARSAATSNAALGAQLALPVWQRDPAVVTLTVTDASGATASAQQQLEFAQKASTQSRAPCGDAAEIAKQKAAAAAVSQQQLEASQIQLALGCAQAAIGGCTGTVLGAAPSTSIADAIAGYYAERDTTKQQISDLQKRIDQEQASADQAKQQLGEQRDHLQEVKSQIRKLLDQYAQMSSSLRSASSATASRRKRRPRAVTLGAATYVLAAGSKGSLKIPLSPAARRIVKRHGYLVFRQVTVAVAPSGKQTVKAKTVVLKRRATKKRKP